MQVRLAQPTDAEGILLAQYSAVHEIGKLFYTPEICASWAKPVSPQRIEKFRSTLERNEYVTFVAESGRLIIGFSQFVPPDKIGAVYVHGQHGRRGAGSELLRAIEENAASGRLWLEGSLSAEAFYLKHGYRVFRRGMHRLSSGMEMPAVFMEKIIANK